MSNSSKNQRKTFKLRMKGIDTDREQLEVTVYSIEELEKVRKQLQKMLWYPAD